MNPHGWTYKDCSELRERKQAARRVAITVIVMAGALIGALAWMLMR